MENKPTLTMESIKQSIREKLSDTLSEANVKSTVSGTSLSKLPKNIKIILIDKLKISARHMNQIYFDKHLKQLQIVINPRILHRADIQVLMDAPEFLFLEFINDIDHVPGLLIAFKYSETGKKKNKDLTKPEKETTLWQDKKFDDFVNNDDINLEQGENK